MINAVMCRFVLLIRGKTSRDDGRQNKGMADEKILLF
jgi:hypothetical protein